MASFLFTKKEAKTFVLASFNRFAMLQADAFRGRAVSLLGFACGVSPVRLLLLESPPFRYN